MESFGSDHLPKLDFFSDFSSLCKDKVIFLHEIERDLSRFFSTSYIVAIKEYF